MKEIQTPRKDHARFSDPSNRRFKDSQLKNRKIAKKCLSSAFSDVSLENTKDPESSEVISDCDAQSFVQGSTPDCLLLPETFALADLSPISTITAVDGRVNVSFADELRLIKELQPAVRSLHMELNELKKIIDPNIIPEERDRIDELVSIKVRVVFLCFLLWILVVSAILFFCSGEQFSSIGPLPT